MWDVPCFWAMKMESPFHIGLLIPSIICTHFLNPHDMRCLLGLWGAEEKEISLSIKEFDHQINWIAFHICVEFMEES